MLRWSAACFNGSRNQKLVIIIWYQNNTDLNTKEKNDLQNFTIFLFCFSRFLSLRVPGQILFSHLSDKLASIPSANVASGWLLFKACGCALCIFKVLLFQTFGNCWSKKFSTREWVAKIKFSLLQKWETLNKWSWTIFHFCFILRKLRILQMTSICKGYKDSIAMELDLSERAHLWTDGWWASELIVNVCQESSKT